MATIGERIGNFLSKKRDSLAEWLMKSGLTPNALTLIGLIVNLFAAFFLAAGFHRMAGLILILANSFDVLDGALARVSNRITRFGDFFDSTIDRYSDLILYSGLIVFYSLKQDLFYVILVCIVAIGSVTTSYVRAKAQNVISVKCDVGFMERPERIVTLIIAALFNHIYIALWVLAITTHLAVIHRVLYVKKWLDSPAQEGEPQKADIYEGKSPLGASIMRIIFLDYERMTWQYDLTCGIIIFILIFPPF